MAEKLIPCAYTTSRIARNRCTNMHDGSYGNGQFCGPECERRAAKGNDFKVTWKQKKAARQAK